MLHLKSSEQNRAAGREEAKHGHPRPETAHAVPGLLTRRASPATFFFQTSRFSQAPFLISGSARFHAYGCLRGTSRLFLRVGWRPHQDRPGRTHPQAGIFSQDAAGVSDFSKQIHLHTEISARRSIDHVYFVFG